MEPYGITRIITLVVLLAASSVQYGQIHDLMTDEEIANIFHTTRANVPEYDVVPVRYNRYNGSVSNLRLKFNAFGKKIDVYLKPGDGQLAGENTPVWLASTKPSGKVEYKKMRDGIVGIVSGFFDSPADLSTVVVSQAKGGKPSFEGIVDSIIVRPLPARFREATRFKQYNDTPSPMKTMLETHYHVIIKSMSIKEEAQIRQMERQIREASRSANKTDDPKFKRSTQELIFPSLLICTDFKGSKMTEDDLAYHDEIMYQLAFWNAVDLRFRHVDNPGVRIRIAGIIIGQDRPATPYLHKHRYENEVRVQEGWPDMQQYWFETSKRTDFPLSAYDVIVTMTDYNLIGKNPDGSKSHVLGMAASRSLCLQPYYKFWALAVVHDKGGFDGIFTAVHELGHVMSLVHDEDTGDECDKSNGYIMQPVAIVGPKNLEWSPCSLKSLSYFLRQPYIVCVDEPSEFYPPGPPIKRFLPGDVLDTHKQCQGRGYSWACDPSPDMCKNMKCYHTHWAAFVKGWWCQNTGPAAEGTTCETGHKCVDGVCQCMTEDCIFEKN